MNKETRELKQAWLDAKAKREALEKSAAEAKDLERELWLGFISQRINELKAMPYHEYLSTNEWDVIRKHYLKEAGYKCQLCNAEGVELHVHHKTYERRGEEHPDDLIALCKDCHAKVHDKYPRAVDEYREWVSGKVAQ